MHLDRYRKRVAGVIFLLLSPGVTLGGGGVRSSLSRQITSKPVADIWGRVLDAASHRSVPGVRVTERGTDAERDSAIACDHVAVTDSTGSYSLTACDKAVLTFAAAGYEILSMRYPEDLRCVGQDNCCGKLRDVELGGARRQR